MRFDPISYFRTIAENHVDICHNDADLKKGFFRIRVLRNLDEFIMNLKYAKSPCLCLLYDGSGQVREGQGDENLIEECYFSWFILRKVDLNRPISLEVEMAQIHTMANEIYSRIHNEMKSYSGYYIDLNMQKYDIGPVGDNWYGLGFNCTAMEKFCTPYNPVRWIDGGGVPNVSS